MNGFTSLLVLLAAILPVILALPTLLFWMEVILAVVVGKQRLRPLVNTPPTSAILIPAHNEEQGLPEMLAVLKQRVSKGQRIVVLADNCTDNTAAVARDAGVEVFERTNPEERGKGYALAFGIEKLRRNPPEVLIILDADCEISPQAIERLAYEADRRGRPVQGLYLCHAPSDADTRTAISAMAFRFKNHVRPLGMSTLGGPAYLTGSGMAIPWDLVEKVIWASGNLVEDMQLGIDLAIKGYSPAHFEGAEICSPLPTEKSTALTQRTRWEHGHLRTMVTQSPRLIWQGLTTAKPALLLLAIDLCVPPLALFTSMSVAGLFLALVVGGFTFVWWPALLAMVECLLLSSAVALGWWNFCRAEVPPRMILGIPAYIGSKLGIYWKFLRGAEQRWVRTQRAQENGQ